MKQQIFVYYYLNVDEVQCVCIVDLKEVTEVKEGEQPYQTLDIIGWSKRIFLEDIQEWKPPTVMTKSMIGNMLM